MSDYTIWDIKTDIYKELPYFIWGSCEDKDNPDYEYVCFLMFKKVEEKFIVYYECFCRDNSVDDIEDKTRDLELLDKEPTKDFVKEKLLYYIRNY